MTTNDIEAIRRLCNRSTGGTWTLRERQSLDRRVLAVISEGEGEMTYADIAEVPMEPGDDINDWRNDAEFIAAGRTLVPALCDEVEQLRAALAKADAQLMAANRRADGLQADLDSAQRGLTEYANQTGSTDAGHADLGGPRHHAPTGCDDCSVEPGDWHRYPECPGNLRAIEREKAEATR